MSSQVLWDVRRAESRIILRYFKDKYNLVCTRYAQRVLGVGEKKFRKIVKERDLVISQICGPMTSFNLNMYNLSDIKKLKEELND